MIDEERYPLSDNQKEVLRLLWEAYDNREPQPNPPELAIKLGCARSYVSKTIHRLEQRGYLVRTHKTRALKLVRRYGEPYPETPDVAYP